MSSDAREALLESEEDRFLELEATISVITDETLLYTDVLGDEQLISGRGA